MKHTFFKGRLLNVSVKKVTLPNGYVVPLEVVKHPGAVLVIPFLTQRKVIILKQLRPVVKKYLYELPAGTLEKGEQPMRCARREIIEETGYSAGALTRLGVIFPVPGYSTEKIVIYKAEHLRKVTQQHQADEVIQVQTITKSRLKYLFSHGKIVDAKTICAFALCGWL
ncbi:MAG: NUDIX hydrolase [Candidatus Omnitrophota bacterium]